MASSRFLLLPGSIAHVIHGLLLLAQLQALVPLERPEAAAADIRRACPIASPRDRQRLDRLEHQLANSAAKNESPEVWQSLGCVRALLALNTSLDPEGEIRRPMDDSRAEAAMGVLIKVLDLRPDDTEAAELLAALSQQATAEGTKARAMLLDDLAMRFHNTVKAGVTSAAVFRACTRLQIAVGDIATARDCSHRAMQLGHDSTWHLLRLAEVQLADEDIRGANALFERAAFAAHDSTSMNELLYPFFTEANWARWVAVPDSARGGWLRDSLFPNKIYQSASYAARLAEQLAGTRIGGGRSLSWWCWPDPPAQCMSPGTKGETVIRTAARFSQFWDLVTGEPIALLTFGVRTGDLISKKGDAGRLADIDLTIHTWDEATHRWSDTTLRRQLRYPASASVNAFAIGRVMIPTSLGVTSWAIRVSQSEARRGRAADDQHAPVGTGPLRLSDLLINVMSPDSTGHKATTEVSAPLGHVGRTKPVQLYFQLWSKQNQPRLKLVVVLRRMFDGGVENVPTVQIAWDGASKQGLNEISRVIADTPLLPGSYRVQVLVMDEVSSNMVRRESTLVVD